VNVILKIIVIMTMTALFSCGNTVIKPKIPVLDPIKVIRFNKPELDCLGKPLKKIVLDRIYNCEGRIETLRGQIKAYNLK